MQQHHRHGQPVYTHVLHIGGSEKAYIHVRDILRFYQFYKLKVG